MGSCYILKKNAYMRQHFNLNKSFEFYQECQTADEFIINFFFDLAIKNNIRKIASDMIDNN